MSTSRDRQIQSDRKQLLGSQGIRELGMTTYWNVVTLGGDGNYLELDSGDSYTTFWIYSKPLTLYTLKWFKRRIKVMWILSHFKKAKLFCSEGDLGFRGSIFFLGPRPPQLPPLKCLHFPTNNFWEANCFSKHHSAKLQGSEIFMFFFVSVWRYIVKMK